MNAPALTVETRNAIAKTFVDNLAAYVGAENMGVIAARNAKEPLAAVCHTHDFADANVFMDAAFKAHGVQDNEAGHGLLIVDRSDDWNAAWAEGRKIISARYLPAIPLPRLETMVALCSEAREALIVEINSHPELRKDRWRVDRSPCLYALDAQGERLNDGSWCAWERRKSDVEKLLRQYPDAHQVIVDGGIDVSENKEAYASSNYEPQFWQATIWHRVEPLYSLQDLESIVRRRTGFTSLTDLLDAKGSYRPSLDMRDPEMAAIATYYDKAMTERGDDRRAYRYGLQGGPGDSPAVDDEQFDEPGGMRP